MKTLWGIWARFINIFLCVREKHWVFGADYGNSYREGSKYLLEYMLEFHKDYTCTFVTQNKDVKKELDEINIPCVMNCSFNGIFTIARAEAIFTCQTMNDVLFGYNKRNRRFYFLCHGQPYKKAFLALPKSYYKEHLQKASCLRSVWSKFTNYINSGISWENSSFLSSTSDFLVPYNRDFFDGLMPVKVLGMPRNDGLFHAKRMAKEKWVSGIEGKFIITYMPTHRFYGKGEPCPTPFINRPEILKWMRSNNVVLLIKQHPNMIQKVKDELNTDVIKDITRLGLDSQVCLYHSNVLISDYSSVWIDFLILKRPLVFYYYDKFEEDDQGVMYDIHIDPPGLFCSSEDELFEAIKRIKINYEGMCPTKQIVNKFHKYVDANSCQRYFETVERELRNN